FQAEDGIRDRNVTGVQTCALPIYNKFAEPNEDLFGVAEGKNVIKIHLESFQSFLIDYELNGEEVTPFINSIVNDQTEDFTYYENFFHQTEQGKTADAELIMDNS